MTRVSPKFVSLILAMAMCWIAAPAMAQYQGSSSVGETPGAATRGLKAPQPITDLVVTAVNAEQGKIKLQHQRQGWNRWFELDDETVIRSASDKQQQLNLSEVQEGQPVSVFIARKLLGGKTIYLNIGDT